MRPGALAVLPMPPSRIAIFGCSSVISWRRCAWASRPSAPHCDLTNSRPICNSGLHL